jgi:hypothetical protein
MLAVFPVSAVSGGAAAAALALTVWAAQRRQKSMEVKANNKTIEASGGGSKSLKMSAQ